MNTKMNEYRCFNNSDLLIVFPVVSKTKLFRILTDTLGYHKMFARWVPKMLTSARKEIDIWFFFFITFIKRETQFPPPPYRYWWKNVEVLWKILWNLEQPLYHNSIMKYFLNCTMTFKTYNRKYWCQEFFTFMITHIPAWLPTQSIFVEVDT